MGKPQHVELLRWVLDPVAEGNTHWSMARRFRVSVKFVNDMDKLMKETGDRAPIAKGNDGGPGWLALTPAQLAMLFEGIDWRSPQRTWQPLAAG